MSKSVNNIHILSEYQFVESQTETHLVTDDQDMFLLQSPVELRPQQAAL